MKLKQSIEYLEKVNNKEKTMQFCYIQRKNVIELETKEVRNAMI